MNTHHGGPVILKPIGEIAVFKRYLLPSNIPETYTLKPMFADIANEDRIRQGVVAYRDFLHIFCDRLASDGHLYAKPLKNPTRMTDYPFLHYVSNLLVDIGYHGKLSESGDSLLLAQIPLFSASVDRKGKVTKSKVTVSGQMDCLRFLTLCGLVFAGIDLEARAFSIPDGHMLEVTYPGAPIMLTGLKAMAVADVDVRKTRKYWNDNYILRCDYRLIMAEESDMLDVLKDFLHPLSENVQQFAIKLHQHYTDIGLTCVSISDDQYHFAYSYIENSRRNFTPRDIYTVRVWEFSLSLRHGYCLFVRSKNTDKYADVIKNFPPYLHEIIARGYGCDRKLRNERCQHGCQGVRIPLDETILDIGSHIIKWLDCETECLINRQGSKR